jgi:epoxyqueuosine reductase QueG
MNLTRRQFIVSTAAGAAAMAIDWQAALGQEPAGKGYGEEMEKMKQELVGRMKGFGAYDVRVADPARGFEHGLPERHPLKLWPGCRSVIVVVTPNAPDFSYIPEDKRNPQDIRRIATDVSPNNTRIYTINRLVPPVMGKALPAGGRFLMRRGFRVKDGAGPKAGRPRGEKEQLQYKMCAYEAGIGVYGRSGFIMHPELGNRICIMTLMTDAPLPPDGKREVKLDCDDCGECVKACTAGAYDAEKIYPDSYDLRTCAGNRNEVLMGKGILCQRCYEVCRASKKTDTELKGWLTARAVEVERKAEESPEGRLPAKVEKFHTAFREWREAGGDPAPVVRIMKDFEPLIRQGKYREAEALIDRAMEIFKGK